MRRLKKDTIYHNENLCHIASWERERLEYYPLSLEEIEKISKGEKISLDDEEIEARLINCCNLLGISID